MRLTTTRTLREYVLSAVLLCLFPFSPISAGDLAEGGNPFQCPEEHVYVYCGELHDNLDYYGYPKVAYGYGSIEVQGPWVSKYLDKCGKGKIIRKWKVKYHYDWYWCEQTIHITDPYGGGGFSGNDVYWPKDYHMKECGGSMHPDHLPAHYSWPEFSHHGCSKLGLRYSDKTHPYHSAGHGYGYGYGHGHDPCKVVYRTWELIDWCQYESGYGGYGKHQTGRWTYEQKIYIYDDIAPEITFCSDDMEVNGGDCKGSKTHVKIPKIKATDDCGSVYFAYSREKINEDANYHSYTGSGVSYSGADASGYYEPGKTLVTFKAFDICGNTTECQMIVDVQAEDTKPPSVIGISSLTAVLVQSDTNDGSVQIWPAEFNTSSYDNCTDAENLKFDLEPSIFTCEDFGPNQVKFTVTDEAGNSDYIMVEVLIQANSFQCIGGLVSGNVMSDAGNAVDQVQISLMDEMRQMTDQEGSFSFENFPLGGHLQLTPYKNTDAMKGVDMYDYALLSLHVDGIKELRDPYQLIAADINGDKQINYADLLALQRLITGLDKSMQQNTAWKIFERNFVFPDALDPLDVEIPESHIISHYDGSDLDVQFRAIKVGDIGQIKIDPISADANSGEHLLVTSDRIVKPGETLTMPFTFDAEASANTVTFTLDIDPDKLEIISINNGKLAEVGFLDFVTPQDGNGAVVGTWFSSEEREFSKKDILFELVVRAKRSAVLSKAMYMTSDFAEAKTKGVRGGINDLKLDFESHLLQSDLLLMQNAPNPFVEETTIGFVMPVSGDATLTIKDATGKTVFNYAGQYEKGYQEITINKSDLITRGLLFYNLVQGETHITKKMMMID